MQSVTEIVPGLQARSLRARPRRLTGGSWRAPRHPSPGLRQRDQPVSLRVHRRVACRRARPDHANSAPIGCIATGFPARTVRPTWRAASLPATRTNGWPGCSSSTLRSRRYHGTAVRARLPHPVRQPLAAAIFLTINGLILFAGRWLRRRAPVARTTRRRSRPSRWEPGRRHDERCRADVRRLATLHYREAGVISSCRRPHCWPASAISGVTMVSGLAAASPTGTPRDSRASWRGNLLPVC